MSNKKFTTIKYSHLGYVYFSANGFKSTFQSLKEKNLSNLGTIQYEDVTPAIATNGLFALELYLKLIYACDYWEKTQRSKEIPLNETQYPKGHKLEKLLNQLEKKSKKTIFNKVSNEISSNEFSDFFKKFSDDFIKWRYSFEYNETMKGDFYSLNIILNALSDYCNNYMCFKMYTPKEWTVNKTSSSVTIHKAKVKTKEEVENLLSSKLSDLT